VRHPPDVTLGWILPENNPGCSACHRTGHLQAGLAGREPSAMLAIKFCWIGAAGRHCCRRMSYVYAGPVWDKILDKALVTSRSVRVREQLFELLSAAWLGKQALQPRLRPFLLAFLADGSAALRGRALEFWHRELPKDVPGRLRTLLLDGAAAVADAVRIVHDWPWDAG